MDTIINAGYEKQTDYQLTDDEAEARRQVDEIVDRMARDYEKISDLLPKLPPYATGYGPRVALGGLAIDLSSLAESVIEESWDRGKRCMAQSMDQSRNRLLIP